MKKILLIAFIPLFAIITAFSVIMVSNSRAKDENEKPVFEEKKAGTPEDGWPETEKKGITFESLKKMTRDEILENDDALLWFRVLSVKARYSLLGRGKNCSGVSVPAVINRHIPTAYGYDLVVPEKVEAYYCRDGSMVVFGNSREPADYKYCMRYSVQWNEQFRKRVDYGMTPMYESIVRFAPVPYSSFFDDEFGLNGIKLIYCTRYKSETLPAGVSMSQASREKLENDREMLRTFFADDPSGEAVRAFLGKEAAVSGNIRKLENNPDFSIAGIAKEENIVPILLGLGFSGPRASAGIYLNTSYDRDQQSEEDLADYVNDELELCRTVFYRQLLSDIYGDSYGKTYYYYDGWLKVVFGCDGECLYASVVEPIDQYTDTDVIDYVSGKWSKICRKYTKIAVPHTDDYIDILLNPEKFGSGQQEEN